MLLTPLISPFNLPAVEFGRAVADEGVIDEQLAVADEGFGVKAAGGLAGDGAIVETADGVVAILVEAEKPDGGVLVLVVAALRGEPRAAEGSAADVASGPRNCGQFSAVPSGVIAVNNTRL
jgi:hypothetical protein